MCAVLASAELYPLLHTPAPVQAPDDGDWGAARLADVIIDFCDLDQVEASAMTPALFFKEYYSKVLCVCVCVCEAAGLFARLVVDCCCVAVCSRGR